MKKKWQPVIESLLDLDYYKFTMMYFVWKFFPNVMVTYGFKNRTSKVKLARIIKESDIRQELEHVRTLRFTNRELEYLAQFFPVEFLKYLTTFQMPEFKLWKEAGTYRIEVTGTWLESILWETIILSIVNELYYRALIKREHKNVSQVLDEGRRRLIAKIVILKAHPEIKITDFGTRRRFARLWHREVLETLKREIPDQLVGTSNVFLAMEFGLKPIGTMAHELFMVLAALGGVDPVAIRKSHNRVLQLWWELYGAPLSIALSDTFGTGFFFEDFTSEQAHLWRGLRHDSGDPFAFGEIAIQFYESHTIDPKSKVLVFSDGLDIETIVKLYDRFHDRINVAFGWGTNLTNDLGFVSLSLVVKAISANGFRTVKLSDNIAKAMGEFEDIDLYKNIFEYSANFFEECKY